jgi:hypothetical protein
MRCERAIDRMRSRSGPGSSFSYLLKSGAMKTGPSAIDTVAKRAVATAPQIHQVRGALRTIA